MDRFSVSIKGVLEADGKLLLRKNERQEFELLGGRLERGDISVEHRLFIEFLEESGIEAEICEPREPWLYEIGTRSVIVIPFRCRPLNIPDRLVDMDGGTLHWVALDGLDRIPMPQGYKDTVAGVVPHTSRSTPSGFLPQPAPGVPDDRYRIRVCVEQGPDTLLCSCLRHPYAPRDFIHAEFGGCPEDGRLAFRAVATDQAQNIVTLNYVISGVRP